MMGKSGFATRNMERQTERETHKNVNARSAGKLSTDVVENTIKRYNGTALTSQFPCYAVKVNVARLHSRGTQTHLRTRKSSWGSSCDDAMIGSIKC